MPPPKHLLFGTLLAGGIFVWWLIVRQWWRGKPLLEAVPDETPRWNLAAVLVTVLWIGLHLLPGPPSEPDLYNVKMGIFINALVLAFLCLLMSDLGNKRFREFGIRLDRWRLDLRAGALGFLAALPPVLLVSWLSTSLKDETGKHVFLRLLEQQPGAETVLWIAVAVIVMAPLFEELLYRVILQGALRSKLPAAASIGISSVLFAGVHGFPDSLALIPLAVVLGYVFEKRRSFLAVVVIHGLFNAANLALALLSGSS